MYFSGQLQPAEVTQEGVTQGLFSSFYVFFFAPPSSCGACLEFYREKGAAIPFPRRRAKSKFGTHELCSYVIAFTDKVAKETLLLGIELQTLLLVGSRLNH